MSIDSTCRVDGLLQHYIRLGAQPGWREYVWHRINLMAKDCPELFGDFPAKVTATLKSAAQPAGTPPVSPSLKPITTAGSMPAPSRS